MKQNVATCANANCGKKNSTLDGAITEFDRAIQLDPKFSAAYIDRGIVFYRLRRFDRAFADVAHAKRIEKSSHITTAKPTTAATPEKPRPPEAVAPPAGPQLTRRRTAAVDPSRGEFFASRR